MRPKGPRAQREATNRSGRCLVASPADTSDWNHEVRRTNEECLPHFADSCRGPWIEQDSPRTASYHFPIYHDNPTTLVVVVRSVHLSREGHIGERFHPRVLQSSRLLNGPDGGANHDFFTPPLSLRRQIELLLPLRTFGVQPLCHAELAASVRWYLQHVRWHEVAVVSLSVAWEIAIISPGPDFCAA